MQNISKIVGITCLVIGNLIGAGILGIPVLAGIAGFWPSVGLMIISCIAMTYSALVLVRRACQEQDPLFNYPSLYARQLGKFGKYIGTFTNALILYGLLTAYIAGGSIILAQLFDINISIWLTLTFFTLMTFLTLCGVKIFEKFNIVFMILLWSAFIIMIIIGDRHINLANLEHSKWTFLLLTIPMVVTGFHFHNLIPTLARHVKYNKKILYIAITIGMLVGLITNTAWLFVGVGNIPLLGHHSLEYCYSKGVPANVAMDALIHSKFFIMASLLFSLLAILTSYVANSLGLVEFCKDFSITYLKIKNNWLPILLTFIPPLAIAFSFPHIFLTAIGIVGGIGIITLFGVLPSIIDYQHGAKKTAILFLLLFTIVLIIQILLDTHVLQYFIPSIFHLG
jgi:tyrosine-specific transport protein